MMQINTRAEWEKAKRDSYEKPVVLYIHSLFCPISSEAVHNLSGSPLNESAYIIPVQTSREISQAIEADLKVRHESPQVIIMDSGRAIYDADHTRIDPKIILEKLASQKQ